jgi:hypothetical protein
MLVIVRNVNPIYGLQAIGVIFIGNLNYQKTERLEESGFVNKNGFTTIVYSI